jgi:hypothetical protein
METSQEHKPKTRGRPRKFPIGQPNPNTLEASRKWKRDHKEHCKEYQRTLDAKYKKSFNLLKQIYENNFSTPETIYEQIKDLFI